MLIDTHAHLYWDSYAKDLGEVIKRSIEASVTTIINIGVDVDLSKTALEQVTRKLAQIPDLKAYSTIAIHPQEAPRYARGKLSESVNAIKKDIEQLETLYLYHPDKVVAVGECGLDYFFSHNPGFNPSNLTVEQIKNLQRELFKAQINLAKKLNLPLIVHVRDDRSENPNNIEAWDEVFEFVGDYPTVLHCYSGLTETTKKALEKPNIIVSFAGNITYPKNEYLREAAGILPLEKIVLETDSPFLAPQSKRGQRNEPASVKEIAEVIAEIKGVSFEKIAKVTCENARQIFAF